MRLRPWTIAAAVALPLAGPAASKPVPKTAPDLSQMSECRLSLASARTLLARMRATGGDEYVIEDEHWMIREYDPATMHPFGKQAVRFKYVAIGEEGGTTHVLETSLAANLGEISKAMLALHGKTQCIQAFAQPIPSECFVTPGDAAKGKPGIWVNERQGQVEIKCSYELTY